MTTSTTANPLDLGTVKKWAKAHVKSLSSLKKKLDKSDDVEAVLKTLDVAEPALRTLRNKARKLKREFPTAARFRSKLLREVDIEVKRYTKILALV